MRIIEDLTSDATGSRFVVLVTEGGDPAKPGRYLLVDGATVTYLPDRKEWSLNDPRRAPVRSDRVRRLALETVYRREEVLPKIRVTKPKRNRRRSVSSNRNLSAFGVAAR